MTLPKRWNMVLDELRAAGRYRELMLPAGIDFVSNDYLGYGREPFPACTEELPHGGLASRLLRGHHHIWEQVESELARWHGAEACLLLNSGYCANEGLLSTVIQPRDWVASDQLNHASIIDGLKLSRAERFVFHHNDLEHLENGLRAMSKDRPADRECFVVTESLFGMEGDRAPLIATVQLAERFGAHVIVDEAHATGCLGPHGSGCVDGLGLRQRVLATVHTGGKALGVTGAYVAGSKLLREVLVNQCRPFVFTTALPPIVGAWWLHALNRVRPEAQRRARLLANAACFRGALQASGIDAQGEDYIVPVILGSDDNAVAVSRQLQNRGWDIRAIRPPTVPPGTARLRISIHANHDETTLRQAAEVLATLISKGGAPDGCDL